MNKTHCHSIMKLGILFFATLFFQTALVSVSVAGETTPFYKSWLQERGYIHPDLRLTSKSSSKKNIAQPKAIARSTSSNAKGSQFWKSWLQERSYAHPGITTSAAVSVPTKNIAKSTAVSGEKRTTPKYKSRPEFNVCKFVCLSTCKTCSKSSSSNYLMSRE
jgi:hypothetical protein